MCIIYKSSLSCANLRSIPMSRIYFQQMLYVWETIRMWFYQALHLLLAALIRNSTNMGNHVFNESCIHQIYYFALLAFFLMVKRSNWDKTYSSAYMSITSGIYKEYSCLPFSAFYLIKSLSPSETFKYNNVQNIKSQSNFGHDFAGISLETL